MITRAVSIMLLFHPYYVSQKANRNNLYRRLPTKQPNNQTKRKGKKEQQPLSLVVTACVRIGGQENKTGPDDDDRNDSEGLLP